MTASTLERGLGRLIRGPEGHEGAPAVAAEPAGTGNTVAVEGTMAPVAVPAKVSEEKPTTAEDLEAEFGGGDDPAPAASEQVAEPVGEGEETAGAVDDTPVKSQTAEERITELVAQAHEEKRLREAAEAEVARLTPPPAKEPAAAEAPAADAEPDPANYEFGEADTQFIKDTSAYAAKAAVREEMAAHAAVELQKTQVRELETKQETVFTAGRAKYPDFDDKVIKGAETQAFPLGAVATLAVLHSPVGQDVAYYLASNVEEAKRIDALSPLEQAREMGRLEARFEGTAATPPAPSRATNAPAPPKHTARGEGGKFSVPDDTNDFKAFEASVDARLAAKR